ncbi:MAG: glycosyltransferase family 9 protein [Mycobacteriales bacterium]
MAPQILLPLRARFSPGSLRAAKAIGIVEMGGLGSVLRTTAVSRALRGSSNADVYWFTHARGSELLRYVPGVRPIDVETNPPPMDLVEQLDATLNFEQNGIAKAIVACSNSVGGFDLNPQARFKPASEHARYMQRMQIDNAARRNNRKTMQEVLLESVGLNDYSPRYDLGVPHDHRDRSRELLHGLASRGRYEHLIALNIGTSRRGELKRWPPQLWVRLATRLADRYHRRTVLLLSGPEDADIREEVARRLRGNPRNNLAMAPENMSIGDFLSVVDKADVMVTGDTFAMHAARALRVPTIVLAGPMPAGELEVGKRDRLIGPKLPCAPCYYHCNQTPIGACMQSVSPRDVLGVVNEILPDLPRRKRSFDRTVVTNNALPSPTYGRQLVAVRRRHSHRRPSTGVR